MTLHDADGSAFSPPRRLFRTHFRGRHRSTRSLVDGPTSDFNVMVCRGRAKTAVETWRFPAGSWRGGQWCSTASGVLRSRRTSVERRIYAPENRSRSGNAAEARNARLGASLRFNRSARVGAGFQLRLSKGQKQPAKLFICRSCRGGDGVRSLREGFLRRPFRTEATGG